MSLCPHVLGHDPVSICLQTSQGVHGAISSGLPHSSPILSWDPPELAAGAHWCLSLQPTPPSPSSSAPHTAQKKTHPGTSLAEQQAHPHPPPPPARRCLATLPKTALAGSTAPGNVPLAASKSCSLISLPLLLSIPCNNTQFLPFNYLQVITQPPIKREGTSPWSCR